MKVSDNPAVATATPFAAILEGTAPPPPTTSAVSAKHMAAAPAFIGLAQDVDDDFLYPSSQHKGYKLIIIIDGQKKNGLLLQKGSFK